ncbi:MAG: Pvc16 family protein [Bacteroidia bacterium]
MIGRLLNIIKDDLNAHFVAKGKIQSGAQILSFPDLSRTGGGSDPILGAEVLNVFLVNLEENRSHRPADLWQMAEIDGSKRVMHPPVKLDVYFLVAAKFKDYLTALDNLTLCIQYFQAHRYFDRHAHHDFPADVDKVIVEMIPMTFEVQRAVWSSLQIAYLPSVLFRMGLLMVAEADESEVMPTVREIVAKSVQAS